MYLLARWIDNLHVPVFIERQSILYYTVVFDRPSANPIRCLVLNVIAVSKLLSEIT